MTFAGHNFPDIVDIIVSLKSDQVLCLHKIADGHALVDQTGRRIGVVRRSHYLASSFLGQLFNGHGNRRALAYDDAVRLHLDGAKLGFIAVAQDHQVVGLDVIFHHIRIGRRDQDLALVEIFALVPDQHKPLQRLQDIGVLGLCL